MTRTRTHACRLRLSLAADGTGVECPWREADEMSSYVQKLRLVSSACQLSAVEEALVLGRMRAEDLDLDLENRRRVAAAVATPCFGAKDADPVRGRNSGPNQPLTLELGESSRAALDRRASREKWISVAAAIKDPEDKTQSDEAAPVHVTARQGPTRNWRGTAINTTEDGEELRLPPYRRPDDRDKVGVGAVAFLLEILDRGVSIAGAPSEESGATPAAKTGSSTAAKKKLRGAAAIGSGSEPPLPFSSSTSSSLAPLTCSSPQARIRFSWASSWLAPCYQPASCGRVASSLLSCRL